MTKRVATWVTGLALAGVTGLPAAAEAQAPGRVQELREDEVTSEKLIEVLKPRGPALHTRGIGAVSDKPNCNFYRKKLTRGIAPVDAAAPAPVADAAAINVQFAFNSAELTPDAMRALDQLGSALTSQELESCCFQIEGHTDAIGGSDYNRRLSERRAQSVVAYLKKRFKIDVDRLLAVGYGKEHPIADNETEDGRSRNRRVQIVNLGFGAPAPE
jgi:outer membrane protein OmpA-like peptidoglycan-associated protein